MPKEIEKRPEAFEKEIAYLRMDFSEVVKLLETIGVDTETVFANSNDAEFESLNDIKSAPTRFSGEPYIRVSKESHEGLAAHATINFSRIKTEVFGGVSPHYGVYSKEDNELASLVYSELLPFSNRWVSRASRIASLSRSLFGFIIIFFTLLILFSFEKGAPPSYEKISPLDVWGALAIGLYGISVAIDRIFKSQLPVVYNPRKTFWEKHGESAIVGICTSLLTFLVTGSISWYLFQ